MQNYNHTSNEPSFADENHGRVLNRGGFFDEPEIEVTHENGFDYDNIQGNTYQETRANLARAEWEDFQERFLPTQNRLIGLATSNELVNGQLERNKRNLETSFASSKRNQSIGLARFGQTPMNSRQNSNNRQLQESLTTASVNNETRTAVDDLQNNIMSGQSVKPRSLAEIGTN